MSKSNEDDEKPQPVIDEHETESGQPPEPPQEPPQDPAGPPIKPKGTQK